jgi:hypothetical protein
VSFSQPMENDISKQDEPAQKITDWLQYLQGWKNSGKSLATYTKEHGLALWAMYHWRGMLIREGHWNREPKASAKSRSRSPLALRFAKVAVTELCPPMLVYRAIGSRERSACRDRPGAD